MERERERDGKRYYLSFLLSASCVRIWKLIVANQTDSCWVLAIQRTSDLNRRAKKKARKIRTHPKHQPTGATLTRK